MPLLPQLLQIIAIVSCNSVCRSCAKVVTISNSQPRLDAATGKILELGDGSIAKFGNRYYLYGVKYVCAPSPNMPNQMCERADRRIWGNMSIGIASSADMVTWQLETYNAVPEMHKSTTVYPAKEFAWFMPTIVKNDTHYALWYYVDDYARGVAVSSSPTGPFTIVHDCIPNLTLGSDFFFWKGPDGDTYMKHNGCGGDGTIVKPGGQCPTTPPRRGDGICVSKLASNMTDIVESSPQIEAPGEGGGIFERDGTWYIMQGHGCCFCFCGDDAQVFESKTGAYGPYTPTNDLINCSLPDYTVGRNCGGPATPKRGPGAQQFGVFPIPQADNTTAYLWIGIRYGSAPDGMKCHEYQYWDALQFDGAGHAKPLHFKSDFTLNLAAAIDAAPPLEPTAAAMLQVTALDSTLVQLDEQVAAADKGV